MVPFLESGDIGSHTLHHAGNVCGQDGWEKILDEEPMVTRFCIVWIQACNRDLDEYFLVLRFWDGTGSLDQRLGDFGN